MSTQSHRQSRLPGLLLQGYIRENYEQKHRTYIPMVLKNQCLLFAYIGDHFESNGNHTIRLGLYDVCKNDNYQNYRSVSGRTANGNVSIDTKSFAIVVWKIKFKITDNGPFTNRCGISLIGKSKGRKIFYEIRNEPGSLAYTGGCGINLKERTHHYGFANNDVVMVVYISTNRHKQIRFINMTSDNTIAIFDSIISGEEIRYQLAVDLATKGTGAEIIFFKKKVSVFVISQALLSFQFFHLLIYTW